MSQPLALGCFRFFWSSYNIFKQCSPSVSISSLNSTTQKIPEDCCKNQTWKCVTLLQTMMHKKPYFRKYVTCFVSHITIISEMYLFIYFYDWGNINNMFQVYNIIWYLYILCMLTTNSLVSIYSPSIWPPLSTSPYPTPFPSDNRHCYLWVCFINLFLFYSLHVSEIYFCPFLTYFT